MYYVYVYVLSIIGEVGFFLIIRKNISKVLKYMYMYILCSDLSINGFFFPFFFLYLARVENKIVLERVWKNIYIYIYVSYMSMIMYM
jgi:hypothetical protein